MEPCHNAAPGALPPSAESFRCYASRTVRGAPLFSEESVRRCGVEKAWQSDSDLMTWEWFS